MATKTKTTSGCDMLTIKEKDGVYYVPWSELVDNSTVFFCEIDGKPKLSLYPSDNLKNKGVDE